MSKLQDAVRESDSCLLASLCVVGCNAVQAIGQVASRPDKRYNLASCSIWPPPGLFMGTTFHESVQ